MKKLISFFLVSIFTVAGFTQKPAKDPLFTEAAVMSIMQKVADWQLNNFDTQGFKRPKYDWTYGACYAGIMELVKLSENKKYKDFLVSIGNDLNWNTGNRRFHADDYCIAQTYCNLYLIDKDKKMILPFRQLADSIIAQPHDESLEWKDGIANREWAWCDALFMGPPALTLLATATGEKKYIDIASKLWWKTTDYLYDPSEHLYFRDQNFFDKKEKNGKKVFWSRGNGWVIAGLVRVIETIPADYPDRPRFIKLYKEMASKIASLQQPDGSWHASLLDPESYPIKETSGTGFYTYALAWGINHKILKRKKYLPVVKKAWSSLVAAVNPDGMLGFVQPIGAAPGKTDANTTDTYGVGAFLLAGSEIYELLNRK